MHTIRQNFLIITVLILCFGHRALADDAVATMTRTSQLPAYLLEMPESVSDILIADAASATLRRFVRAGNRIIEKDQRYMSIGLNGMGKQRAWDRKTPLGVYFITEKIDTSNLNAKYGVAAYALDYPNAWDRQKQRTGSGIWLHGVDRGNPDRPPRDTDGCLALPNEELTLLADVLEPQVTPIIVARKVAWASPEELRNTRQEFRGVLDTWRNSLASGDLDTFLSLYAEDFQYRAMDKDEWSLHRRAEFEAQRIEGVKIDDLMLLADPEEPNLYLSRFRQILSTDAGRAATTKRLYWRRTDSERWEIVSEDSEKYRTRPSPRYATSFRRSPPTEADSERTQIVP